MSSEIKSTMLIDVVDSETRNGLMRLNQKLSGLQAEISSKLDFLSATDPEAEAKKQQLLLLADEIGKALQSITSVMRSEISSDLTTEQFLEMNQEELDKFREVVKNNSDQLTKMADLL
jgi:hypothetical protein